jgi:hypothetical protein
MKGRKCGAVLDNHRKVPLANSKHCFGSHCNCKLYYNDCCTLRSALQTLQNPC